VEAILEGIELLVPVVSEDQELAVEHVATGRQLELGEVAAKRLAAA
jgi:hypothetical protein